MYQKEQTNFSGKEMQPQNQKLDQVTSVGEQKWQTQMKQLLSTGMCKQNIEMTSEWLVNLC